MVKESRETGGERGDGEKDERKRKERVGMRWRRKAEKLQGKGRGEGEKDERERKGRWGGKQRNRRMRRGRE